MPAARLLSSARPRGWGLGHCLCLSAVLPFVDSFVYSALCKFLKMNRPGLNLLISRRLSLFDLWRDRQAEGPRP